MKRVACDTALGHAEGNLRPATDVKGFLYGVTRATGSAPGAAVKMKVPPHVVRVKYKTTRYCGVEVDTPRMRVRVGSTSVFLGFSCGKLWKGASFAGFVNAA